MLHVLAFITAKPGLRDAVLAEFRANMPAVHAEEGCIEYVPVVDAPTFGPFRRSLGQTRLWWWRSGRALMRSTRMQQHPT